MQRLLGALLFGDLYGNDQHLPRFGLRPGRPRKAQTGRPDHNSAARTKAGAADSKGALTPKPDCHPLREPPQNNGYPTNTLDNGPNLQPFGPPSARNPSQHMSLLIVHFLGCPNCNILPERACGSLARHPTHGPAVITCFHGPVSRRGRCTCTPPPGLISGDGAVLSVLETVEARDVAWLSIKVVPRTPREVSANTPIVGDTLTVVLPGGTVQATVRGRSEEHT